MTTAGQELPSLAVVVVQALCADIAQLPTLDKGCQVFSFRVFRRLFG